MGNVKFAGAALCLALTACVQEKDVPPPTTPQITADAADADLRAVLPSTEDVNAAYGDPGVFESLPVNDASLYDNPDPRGPCGAKIAQPDFQDAAIATYQSTSGPGMLAIAVAWDLPQGEAATFVRKHVNDAQPGCPPFTSQTPFHTKQHVNFLGEVSIPPIGDLRWAGSQRIQVQGQPTAYASGFLASDDLLLVAVTVVGESEPSERFVRALVEATGKRLES